MELDRNSAGVDYYNWYMSKHPDCAPKDATGFAVFQCQISIMRRASRRGGMFDEIGKLEKKQKTVLEPKDAALLVNLIEQRKAEALESIRVLSVLDDKDQSFINRHYYVIRNGNEIYEKAKKWTNIP